MLGGRRLGSIHNPRLERIRCDRGKCKRGRNEDGGEYNRFGEEDHFPEFELQKGARNCDLQELYRPIYMAYPRAKGASGEASSAGRKR